MAQYLTYAKYREWGGTLDESAFNLAEIRARARIDAMTMGRLRAACQRIPDSRRDVSAEGENGSGNSGGLDGASHATEEVPEQVQAAMMEIISVDQAYSAGAQAAAPVVASFTTDGYSESYGGVEGRTEMIERQLTDSILTLLDGVLDDEGTPLTFAGVPTTRDL